LEADLLTQRICELAATVFDLPLEAVTVDSSTETVEQWDSLGRLVLVLELEQVFGVSLPPEVAQDLTSVRAITAALKGLGVIDGKASIR
jgi:acyl carrier protein